MIAHPRKKFTGYRWVVPVVWGAFVLFPTVAWTQSDLLSPAYFSLSTGKKLLDEGESEKALEVFKKALEQDPSSLLLNLYMGKAAFEAQDYEEALFAFDRVLILEPENALALLEKARTLIALGHDEAAQQALKTALTLEMPAAASKSAEELLWTLKEKPAATEPSRRCYMDASLIFGATADSNASVGTGPLILPATPLVMNPTTARSDNIWFWSAVGQYQYPAFCSPWYWHLGGVIHVSDYEHLHDNDLFLYSILGGIRYVGQKHYFDLSYTWTPIELNRQAYQNHRKVSLTFRSFCHEKTVVRLFTSFTLRHHYDSNPGILDTSGHVADSYFNIQREFCDGFYGYVVVGHRYDHSPRDNAISLRYNRGRVTGGMSWQCADTVTWDVAIHWRKDIYHGLHIDFTDRERTDRYLAETVLLSLNLWPKVTAQFYLEHVENRSNVPLHQYRTDRGTFMILVYLQ